LVINPEGGKPDTVLLGGLVVFGFDFGLFLASDILLYKLLYFFTKFVKYIVIYEFKEGDQIIAIYLV
jgi:hypothetical protein